MLPGHYGTGGEVDIHLPEDLEIPWIIKFSGILDGTLKIHLSIVADDSEVVCIDTALELSSGYWH